MPVDLQIGFILVGLFAIITAANWMLTSQCMSAIQGDPAEARLKSDVAATRPSRFISSLGEGHPSDTRIWQALRRADYLPNAIQRKARIIGWLYELARLIFILAVATIVAATIVR
ncbi:MAG: hypothetical protein JSR72_04060 [Proteobacteria bacterium]|nr:hypothetical protein [Pseudomonadota bacterium]